MYLFLISPGCCFYLSITFPSSFSKKRKINKNISKKKPFYVTRFLFKPLSLLIIFSVPISSTVPFSNLPLLL